MIELRGGSFSAFNYESGRSIKVFNRDPIWAEPHPDMEITKLGIRLALCEDSRVIEPTLDPGYVYAPTVPDNLPEDRLREILRANFPTR